MHSVVIDNVEYKPVRDLNGKWSIVVLDRGFVVVGTVSYDGSYIIIEKCQNIRRWGTTRGLGQLASEGPTADTELDPQPSTKVHELQVVQIIDCDGDKWIQ